MQAKELDTSPYHPVSIQVLKCDQPLPANIFLMVGERYVKYRKQGDPLETEARTRLEGNGVTQFFTDNFSAIADWLGKNPGPELALVQNGDTPGPDETVTVVSGSTPEATNDVVTVRGSAEAVEDENILVRGGTLPEADSEPITVKGDPAVEAEEPIVVKGGGAPESEESILVRDNTEAVPEEVTTVKGTALEPEPEPITVKGKSEEDSDLEERTVVSGKTYEKEEVIHVTSQETSEVEEFSESDRELAELMAQNDTPLNLEQLQNGPPALNSETRRLPTISVNEPQDSEGHAERIKKAQISKTIIKKLLDLEKKKPKDIAIKIALGRAYMEAKRLDEGIQIYKTTKRQFPLSSAGPIGIIECYLAKKWVMKAQAEYEEVVLDFPTDEKLKAVKVLLDERIAEEERERQRQREEASIKREAQANEREAHMQKLFKK